MTPKERKAMLEKFPEYADRGTGRTTGHIFRILGRCYELPGEWLIYRDHADEAGGPTEGTQHMTWRMKYTLDRLGFRHFEFRKVKSVTYPGTMNFEVRLNPVDKPEKEGKNGT